MHRAGDLSVCRSLHAKRSHVSCAFVKVSQDSKCEFRRFETSKPLEFRWRISPAFLCNLPQAHKKGIRRATVNTFGYIAKAIGPQDVLATLLNNLKVQERQNRVCTTVAIAIVAETCSPFTVLPALMNE